MQPESMKPKLGYDSVGELHLPSLCNALVLICTTQKNKKRKNEMIQYF
jgi:hypothetical protein